MPTTYQQLLDESSREYSGIIQGYGNLTNQVLNDIRGVGASQRQGIRDIYAQQAGTADQQLINSGLGNTTVRQSVQRGLVADRAKADIALSNQLAQLTAGYRANIGLAGQGYRGAWQAQQFAAGAQGLRQHNPWDPFNGRSAGGAVASSGYDPRAAADQRAAQDRAQQDAWDRMNAQDPMVMNPYAGTGLMGGGHPAFKSGGYGQSYAAPADVSVLPQQNTFGWGYASPDEMSNPVAGYSYDWSGTDWS